jgi:pilus assembly protein CpaE
MKALLVSNSDRLPAEIAVLVASRSVPVGVVRMKGGLAEASARIASDAPDLLILDDSNSGGIELGLLGALNVQYPHVALMLLTPDQSPQMLLRAMRVGVREVLPLPLEHQTLNDALDRITQKTMSSTRSGKVISFISCKGGSGATFIATNFGYTLAMRAKKKVLLIDLSHQFGDAALYMSDKKPTTTLSDVCAQINRIDTGFLASSLVEITPDFGILAASDDPTHSADIKPEHIDTILRVARSYYDYVVLDVGRQIDAVRISALDQSDLIYPVLQLSMPYIRDATHLLEIFHSLGYRRDKTHLIVNRFERGGELRLSDMQAAAAGCEVRTMPNNYRAVAEAIDQGLPVLELSRNSPIAKSLIALVDQVAGRRATKDAGVLSRLFGNRIQAVPSNG